MSIKWRWIVIFCLSAFATLGEVASSLDIPGSNISNYETENTYITNNSSDQWNYKSLVLAATKVTINGTGTTVFEEGVHIGHSMATNLEDNSGLYITNGTNTFIGINNSNLMFGYLTLGEGSSTNVFKEGLVSIGGEASGSDYDRHLGLEGYALAIGGGNTEFQSGVGISNNAAFFASASRESTAKFTSDGLPGSGLLAVGGGTGKITISYGGDVKNLGAVPDN